MIKGANRREDDSGVGGGQEGHYGGAESQAPCALPSPSQPLPPRAADQPVPPAEASPPTADLGMGGVGWQQDGPEGG